MRENFIYEYVLYIYNIVIFMNNARLEFLVYIFFRTIEVCNNIPSEVFFFTKKNSIT